MEILLPNNCYSFLFTANFLLMSLYQTSIKNSSKLQEQLWKKNIFQVPKIDKIIVAMWVGSLATRKWVKDFSDLENNLRAITGQQPQMILSRKSVSNFKLREGMPAMLRCTLRWERAYDFVERLVTFVLPRVRDFEGLNTRKFDGMGNYNLWLPSQSVFGELTPEDIKTPMWLQITIATTADNDPDSKAFLESLWIIFAKK